jgi:hypothetical protein
MLRETIAILVTLGVVFYLGFALGRGWEREEWLLGKRPKGELDFTLLSRTRDHRRG